MIGVAPRLRISRATASRMEATGFLAYDGRDYEGLYDGDEQRGVFVSRHAPGGRRVLGVGDDGVERQFLSQRGYEVERRRAPGRRVALAVPRVEDVRHQLDLREHFPEQPRPLPVRGGAAAVQQAGSSQDESTRAQRHHPRSTSMGAAEGLLNLFRHRRVPLIGRHDEQIRVLGRFQAQCDVDGKPGLGVHLPRRRRADLEVEGWHPRSTRGTVNAEHLAGDPEFERRGTRKYQHSHVFEHESIMAVFYR